MAVASLEFEEVSVELILLWWFCVYEACVHVWL